MAEGGERELGTKLLGPDLGLCVCHAEEGASQGQGGAGPDAVHVVVLLAWNREVLEMYSEVWRV